MAPFAMEKAGGANLHEPTKVHLFAPVRVPSIFIIVAAVPMAVKAAAAPQAG